jgi:hypothetical protein
MADFVVTTLLDTVDANDGLVSLREALALAGGSAGADIITFSESLTGGATPGLNDGLLVLTNDELIIDSDVTIDGDAVGNDNVADITIDGGGSRVFHITAGTATLDALVITGGGFKGISGGGLQIESGASVAINHSLISGNTAGVAGAGIYNQSTATLTNTTVADNIAFHGGGGGGGRPGGGIFNGASGTITLVNSTLWGNSGSRGAGITTPAPPS